MDFLMIVLKLTGLVSVSFMFYVVRYYLVGYFAGDFEPEIVADRKAKRKSREFFKKKYPGMTYRNWKIKKLHERRMELVFELEHRKAQARKRSFFG